MPALAAHPFERGNRAIAIAVVLSLALHAALLSILPSLREAQQRRSDPRDPILARLTQPTPASFASPAAAAPPPAFSAPSTRPMAVPSAPKRAPQMRPTLEATPVAPPNASSVESEATAKDTIAPSADAPISLFAVPQVATRLPQPSAETPDAGTLAQYRLALISAAKRFKRYPRVALDNDWQGKVEVRIVIDASGAIATLSVRSSAGHPLLDRQALEMIERAKELALIPPALRGKEFSVDIPVVFSLREPDA
jgi:periplasmic protein TonB